MLTIAWKEILDAARDTRSLMSSIFYCLMGPAVVWLVARAVGGPKAQAVLGGMISVFALVAAFSGGMNVAMDIIAGERERRSLLPLLGNPVSRQEVVLGKWIAVVVFSSAGSLLCLAAFALVQPPAWSGTPLLVAGLLPLVLLASALEIGLSTLCASVKEAHTYLSMLVFAPMAVGMFGVFFAGDAAWYAMLPLAGQQALLQQWFLHQSVALVPAACLALSTLSLAGLILAATARLFERDHAIYGR